MYYILTWNYLMNKNNASYIINTVLKAQDPKENSIANFWKSMSTLINLISMLNIGKQFIIQ